jgi:uncharacterized membrane protein
MLRIVGTFATRWLAPTGADPAFVAFAGLVCLSCLAWVALRPRMDPDLVLLGLALLALAFVSAVPAASLSVNPLNAGPRYYFLPFAVLLWTLVILVRAAADRRRSLAAGVVLCAGLLGLATTFSRAPMERTAQLVWKDELRKCATSTGPVVGVPIYTDGSETYWYLGLTPEKCRRYVGSS